MLLSDVCLTSDVCLSVAYIGPESRTEMRPRKTKIGTEIAHVTRKLRHVTGRHFQGQKVKVTKPLLLIAALTREAQVQR